MKPTQKREEITFDSLASCSASTGVPIGALRKGKRLCPAAFPGSRVKFLAFVEWWFSQDQSCEIDYAALKAKKMALENDALEMDLADRHGDTIRMEDAKQLIRNSLMPVRQRLVALPAEMAHRCNPSDPGFARKALEGWRTEAMEFCRVETMKEQPAENDSQPATT